MHVSFAFCVKSSTVKYMCVCVCVCVCVSSICFKKMEENLFNKTYLTQNLS